MHIGIDLGGTKTEIICLNDSGKELYRKRVPSPQDVYQDTINNIQNLVEEVEKSIGAKATIGIGIPGTISRDHGLVKNGNSTWINGQPLKKDLEAALDRKIFVENDANCFAVSEAKDGAGKGASVVFGVIIGTGCGGAVVIDGKPISGINGIGGEWGHNPLPYPRVVSKNAKKDEAYFAEQDMLPPISEKKVEYYQKNPKWNEYPGVQCYCGHRGCLETWISGTGFKLDYQRVENEDLSTHEIITNARDGEPKAKMALERYVDRMARALSTVINVIDPDVIVLGGGMSNVDELYTMVPKIWTRYVFSDIVHTKLEPPRFGDSSGVRGAAWLGLNK